MYRKVRLRNIVEGINLKRGNFLVFRRLVVYGVIRSYFIRVESEEKLEVVLFLILSGMKICVDVIYR